MTPDETERRMEFIIEQQAQFAAHMGEMREEDARLRESQATLTASVLRLAELMEESEKRTEAHFERIDERLAELAEAGKRTDERLNALIALFERHITGPDHARPSTQ